MISAGALAELDQLVATYADVTATGATRYLAVARAALDGTVELVGDDALDGYLAGAISSAAQANAFRFALSALEVLGLPIGDAARGVLVELDRNASSYRGVEMRER